MTKSPHILSATDRVRPTATTCNRTGRIVWSPAKTLWLAGHGVLGMIGVLFFFETSAAVVFLVLTAVTICAGHSVGMHRLLIHRSFKTPRPVEYVLVWLGTLVGMAGPFGMIRTHDLRDWHQRQAACPPHPAHGAGFWRDAWWQLCCAYRLEAPPGFRIEAKVANDPVYRTMERFWMAQQLVPGAALYALGGWGWVLWGVSLRIFVSLVGHWAVGHFAHRSGHAPAHATDMTVPGYNLPGLSLLTFGENWHGNHHAFPRSARLGVSPRQLDPGYWFILGLAACGLASDIRTPETAEPVPSHL